MAMGAAALNDAAAWCLLVLAISLGDNHPPANFES
jgi:Kef-type K+ transport system membrane component KefB